MVVVVVALVTAEGNIALDMVVVAAGAKQWEMHRPFGEQYM